MSRQAKLVYQTPDGREEEQPLTPGVEASIGRHPQCTVTVSQPSVSRKHARLDFDGQTCMVEDLQSSNGTYVNNQRITRSALRNGDALRCGDFQLRYVEEDVGTLQDIPRDAVQPAGGGIKMVGSLRSSDRNEKVRPTLHPRDGGQEARPPSLVPREPIVPKSRAEARPEARPDVRPDARPDARPYAPPPPPPDESFAGDIDTRIERMREEIATWKGLYEKLKASGGGGEPEAWREEKGRLDKRIEDLRGDIEARDRRIGELEAAKVRAEEQRDTQAERAVRLREQVTAQQGQLEEYRREKVALDVELGEARQRLEEMRSAQQVGSTRESELADEVNNLKREVRQREKALRDIEQRLEVAEYDNASARKQQEELKFALEDDRNKQRLLNEQLDHLRQVLVEKEGMLENTKAEVDRWRKRAELAEERAREDGGAQAARLADALDKEQAGHAEAARRAEALGREVDDLRKQLDEATKGAGNTRKLMEQINELKRENRDLRSTMESAQPVAADAERLKALEARLESAERERHEVERARVRAEGEVKQLKVALDRARDAADRAPAPTAATPAVSASAGGGAGMLDAAVGVYEGLNDLAADLRTNIELSAGMVRDLKPLILAADKLRGGGGASEVDVIRRTAEDVDAALTMESAEDAMEQAEQAVRSFRTQMRTFRDLLQQHGYGS
ncbi:MAG: FHA domain-containing protein [bacterium]|nr:FHA domain-containing protein [Myxococcales bacterium]MCB9551806.1 FHA domain-containing protein [Myxococcales bacterium]